MASRQECLNPAIRRGQQGFHGRRHPHMADQQREIPQPGLPGLKDGHGGSRRGGLETDGEEHHLPVGILAGNLQGIQRRIQRPHLAAGGPCGQQVAPGAGHAQHVAEGAQDGARGQGDSDGLVDGFQRRDADRAAGPVNQLDAGGQQPVDAVLEDGMRLPAADLHDGPGSGAGPGDRIGQGSHPFRLAVLVLVFHGQTVSAAPGHPGRQTRPAPPGLPLRRVAKWRSRHGR